MSLFFPSEWYDNSNRHNMGIENSFTQRRDAAIDRSQNRVEHPVLKRMHAEARRILDDGSIDPTTFIDLYGNENVTRDLRKVETLKAKFENSESKSASEIFEALVLQHTELSDWLGPNAETIRTSEFDDIINGVDLVLEFNENQSTKHLALGVDITFGSLSMQKKFERIKMEIEKDELAVVKYFRAHGYEGSLKQLPRVVIGVDIDKVINLAGLWERHDNKALQNHITKDIIAEEIEKQLRTFLVYAQSISAENAVRSYTQALGTVKDVRTVRNGFVEDRARSEMAHGDRVYQEILKNLERFRMTSRPR
jgi:hypothetical protein